MLVGLTIFIISVFVCLGITLAYLVKRANGKEFKGSRYGIALAAIFYLSVLGSGVGFFGRLLG